jgi:Eukaryotic protein of unknown function (DUF1764)
MAEAGSPQSQPQTSKKRGWDEIEMLFDGKKKAKEHAERDKEELRRTALRKRSSPKEPKSSYRYKKDGKRTSESSQNDTESWVDDGLGGKYNSEGYTGRVEDGVKIFKAHILSKPNAGQSPQCPFDCTCCYI